VTLTFRHSARISKAHFKRVLEEGTSAGISPCAPIADECYDIVVANDLDPAVALGFFAHESQYGCTGYAPKTKNWGNVRTAFKPERTIGQHPANFAIFPDWQTGLLDWCERINVRYIDERGLDTVEAAIPVYAPGVDGNNEAAYIEHVNKLVATWMAEEAGGMAGQSDGWYPGAIKIAMPGFWKGNKGRKAIVNHVIVGSIQSCINTFKGGQKSSTFGFAQNGDIYQFVSIWDSAWANGLSWVDGRWMDPEGAFVNPPWSGLEPGINPNLTTISFEHEGQSGDPWSPEMFASNNAVTAWCADQCGMHIAVHETLIGHNEISPINRAHCPGSGCDLFAIAAAVNSPAPRPALPDGTFPVDAKLKDYYERSGGLWQPERYGLGYALTPLQPDPAHPGAAIQKFERAALRLRPDGGIDALLRSEW
jgi:hypothetical protein